MPKRTLVVVDGVLAKLQKLLFSGPLKASEACAQLNISQSSFSRIAAKSSGNILVVGKASRTMYVLKRDIPDVGNYMPIHIIDENGKASMLGKLHAVFPRGFYFAYAGPNGRTSRFFDDLPYFMDDLRPNGFLGRLIPSTHPELNLPQNINDWSANDSLRYLTKFGSDLIGNLLIGDTSLDRYLQKYLDVSDLVDIKDRVVRYPVLATDILQHGDPGSSAGGEQPKFPAVIGPNRKNVLVKFSPKTTSEIGRRRADLLICEHLSLEILRRNEQNAATSSLIIGDDQVFLETERFDRVGKCGRRGLISLRALCAEFVGKIGCWTDVAKELLIQHRISKEDYDAVRWRELFGNMIANTDMHLANLSFYFQPERILSLAPAYDMLPMLYAPQNEQLIEREFTPPTPKAHELDIWKDVARAAKEFWTSVSSEPKISSGFRKIAGSNVRKLASLERVQDLLP